MEPREWQDEILQAAKPIIQLSAIGFDGDSPTCVQAAHDLGMVLDESVVSSGDGEEELLSEFVPIGTIAADAPGLGIGELALRSEDANAWNHLSLFGQPTRSRRADGRKLLQLYLLLPARYICEDGPRNVLIRGLQSCIDNYAACTILFVEEEAIKADRPIDSEQAEAWINQFDVLSPCRIAAFYVATRLESGQPVSTDEIAESLAVLIAGDILCNADSDDRLLTRDPHTDVRTFGAVGSRVIRFAPHRLAEAFADRAVDAVLQATVFNDADGPAELPLDSLPPAPAILDRVVERSVAEHVDLKLAGSHSRAGHGVVGYNHATDSAFAGGIDFKTDGFKIRLDDLPRSEWLDALFEWDFLHHQEVVKSWLDGLDDAFHAVGNDVITATDQRVIDHVKEHPRLDKAAESVSRAASVARSGYRLSLTPTESSELNVSLERLRECLAAIPHAPSLVARVLVLIMLQGIAGWMFWQHSLPFAEVAMGVLLLLSMVTVGSAMWSYMRSAQRAWMARNRAADEIEERCELAAAKSLVAGMCEFQDGVAGRLDRIAGLLSQMREELRRRPDVCQHEDIDAAQSRVARELPLPAGQIDLYAHFLNQEVACQLDGYLNSAVKNRIAEGVAHALVDGDADVPRLCADLRSMCLSRLRSFLMRHRIADFVEAADSDLLKTKRPSFDWLTQRTPPWRFFFEGDLAAVSAAGSHEPVERLLLPSSMRDVQADSPSLPVAATALRNVVARVACVEIARGSRSPAGGSQS